MVHAKAEHVTRWRNALLFAVGLISVLAVAGGRRLELTFEQGDVLTRDSIRLALLYYALAILLMLTERAPTIARWCWTWGSVAYLIHVAFAFHFYHHWSHAEAFAHVERESGFGPGIFVTYFFTVLWFLDVTWWWSNERGYVARPRWITVGVHSFMMLIIVNGAIVFETGLIRWISVAFLVGMAVAAFAHSRKRGDGTMTR